MIWLTIFILALECENSRLYDFNDIEQTEM